MKYMAMNKNNYIGTLIKRRRRQILVHSYIYYRLDQNIISDDTWSMWAEELEELQRLYPAIAANVEMAELFKDFDHSTGANLDFDSEEASWVHDKAMMLLREV